MVLSGLLCKFGYLTVLNWVKGTCLCQIRLINYTTRVVSQPWFSHLLTVIVVQVPISMQTKPLPLPLLKWNKHTVFSFSFTATKVTGVTHTVCKYVHTEFPQTCFQAPAQPSIDCSTVRTASDGKLDRGNKARVSWYHKNCGRQKCWVFVLQVTLWDKQVNTKDCNTVYICIGTYIHVHITYIIHM